METLIKTSFHWQRPALLALIALAALAVAIFGLRAYRSFLLLRLAYELGAPAVSSVGPWMTLDYVARAYQVSGTALAERLGLTQDADPTATLITLARKQCLSPFVYLRQVQEAISELRFVTSPPGASDAFTEPGGLGDDVLTALLVYGYPVLGLTLMLGAVGMPFPSALSVVVAGSLAAQGHLSWLGAGAVVVASSVLGDLAGYGLGRVLGREFFEQRGYCLTPALRVKVEIFFQNLGILTVILSRSLLSFKSSAVNLLAGASRYRLRLFLPFAIVGRLIWSSVYFGLGYGFGVAIEAAADFTNSLSGLLVSLRFSPL